MEHLLTPPPASHTPHHQRVRLIVILTITALLIGLAILAYPILRTIYVSNNWYKLGSNEVALSLEPDRVQPGQTFTIVARFKKAYDFGSNLWAPRLTISDSSGADVWLDTEFSESQDGQAQNTNQFYMTVESAIDTQPGIIKESLVTTIEKRKTNPNSFYLEQIGCPLSLGPPSEPPRPYTDRTSFVVLQQTPPGEYVISLQSGAFCNGLPVKDVALTLTILPK